jgi:hypothetical protein
MISESLEKEGSERWRKILNLNVDKAGGEGVKMRSQIGSIIINKTYRKVPVLRLELPWLLLSFYADPSPHGRNIWILISRLRMPHSSEEYVNSSVFLFHVL